MKCPKCQAELDLLLEFEDMLETHEDADPPGYWFWVVYCPSDDYSVTISVEENTVREIHELDNDVDGSKEVIFDHPKVSVGGNEVVGDDEGMEAIQSLITKLSPTTEGK